MRGIEPTGRLRSPPTRGRGLKLRHGVESRCHDVAPHAGAWIETAATDRATAESAAVAPHAGAWIETSRASSSTLIRRSPPTRGRGLKLARTRRSYRPALVAPHAGAWIETSRSFRRCRRPRWSPPTRGRGLKLRPIIGRRRCPPSPPTRGRGLKPVASRGADRRHQSPPTRGRGLKLATSRRRSIMVAPHAGAWIETGRQRLEGMARSSPPTRGRGLKPRQVRPSPSQTVAPHAGAWIETVSGGDRSRVGRGRPPRGGVD